MADAGAGRANQKSRTRRDLLRAAARLMKAGRSPTLEEVAEEAMVSRATAYRYFPGLEALLVEAALDVEAPDPDALFAGDAETDPAARVRRVDEALDALIRAHEPALRTMLVHSLQRGPDGGDVPARQNRRTPLLEAALAPARGALDPAALERLVPALAMIVGTEGHVVLKDVLRLPEPEARAVKDWAIAALVQAARRAP